MKHRFLHVFVWWTKFWVFFHTSLWFLDPDFYCALRRQEKTKCEERFCSQSWESLLRLFLRNCGAETQSMNVSTSAVTWILNAWASSVYISSTPSGQRAKESTVNWYCEIADVSYLILRSIPLWGWLELGEILSSGVDHFSTCPLCFWMLFTSHIFSGYSNTKISLFCTKVNKKVNKNLPFLH